VLKDFVFINEHGRVSLDIGKEIDGQLALSRFVSQKFAAVPFYNKSKKSFAGFLKM
jgi:hypothetical protein